MTALTLYHIAAEHRALADQLQNMDLDEQTVLDTLQAESSLVEKSQSVAFVIRNLDTFADSVEAEAKAMAERAKRVRARSDSVRSYLYHCMKIAGVSKIEHPQFTLSIRKNPASVQIDGADLIPAEFMRQPEPPPAVPDKKAIKAAIEGGRDVPGASLVRGESLQIK
ncbi:siphovirus Gp157 family protein [Cupriavidus taiwanensis]|uniref:siphovirus Gp157 family protein n=1 Tax=Cupriavidus taiwanensis TaxID=164546 RepID=UPI0015737739|nr:siphovirus Gp157 family protein [Cupriavidus taiwanensis]NSX14038.1 siphovirus Gp157 family protein [Cupriavidus taiwanensis]